MSILFAIWSVFNAKAQTFPAGFSQQIIDNGLVKPTVFAFAPDGRIFVCEQQGKVRVIKNGSLLARNFHKVAVAYSGERGLCGIAFDPDFNTNHYLYLYYTRQNKVNNRISRYTVSGDTVVPGSEVTILDLDTVTSVNHNAGFIKFGPDGKLYVCVGENLQNARAQDLDTYMGKILRINADGSIPTGNPFTTGSVKRQRIWAYGCRNPYGLSWQPGTNRFFYNDPGTTKWEEINDCTTPGLNFGWPATEGNGTNPAYTYPVYTYPHGNTIGTGCAISGGTFFGSAGTNYPAAYHNKYYFHDFCGGWIDMLTFNGATVTRSNFASNIAGLPVGMLVGPDGNLYFVSRDLGAMCRIVYGPTPVTLRLNPVADAYVRAGSSANTNFGRATALNTQANATAASNYESFLRFDLTTFNGTVSSSFLRVYGGLSSSAIPSLTVEAHNCTDLTWLDTTITWSNKPAAQAPILATAIITGVSKEYYEWDLSAHINALKTGGATGVTIKLNNTTATAVRGLYISKESANYKPQLVINYLPGPVMNDDNRIDASVTQDFDIYPNPAGDFFNITFKNMEGDARLAIYDLQGKLVVEKIIENSNERIDTENLNNGVYLVMVSNRNGVMSKKVLLNRE